MDLSEQVSAAAGNDRSRCHLTSLPVEVLELISSFIIPDSAREARRTRSLLYWSVPAVSEPEDYLSSIIPPTLGNLRLVCSLFSRLTTVHAEQFHTIHLRPLRKDLPRLQQIAQYPHVTAHVREVIFHPGIFTSRMTEVRKYVDVRTPRAPGPFVVEDLKGTCQRYYKEQDDGLNDGTFATAWADFLGQCQKVENIIIAPESHAERIHIFSRLGIPTSVVQNCLSSIDKRRVDPWHEEPIKPWRLKFTDSALQAVKLGKATPTSLVSGYSCFASCSGYRSSNLSLIFDVSKLRILDLAIYALKPGDDDAGVLPFINRAIQLQQLSLRLRLYDRPESGHWDLSKLVLPHLEHARFSECPVRALEVAQFLKAHESLSSITLERADTMRNTDTAHDWRQVFRIMREHVTLSHVDLIWMLSGMDEDTMEFVLDGGFLTVRKDRKMMRNADGGELEESLSEYLNQNGPWTSVLADVWGQMEKSD